MQRALFDKKCHLPKKSRRNSSYYGVGKQKKWEKLKKIQIFTAYMITQVLIKVNIILCFFLIRKTSAFHKKKDRLILIFNPG